ncbi:MAG: hypothetical protein ACKVP0_02260 [Pirellulaceae bacterium]
MSTSSSENESTARFLGGIVGVAILIGLLLVFVLVVFAPPEGRWVTHPRGVYACWCASLVMCEGILLGLFIGGCGLFLAPHDVSVTINRPSTVIVLGGGLMSLACAVRVFLLLGAAVGIFSHADMPTSEDRDRAAKEQETAKWRERESARRAIQNAESDRGAKELAAYFTAGGLWSTELYPAQEDVSAVVESGFSGPSGPAGAGAGQTRPIRPKLVVLVFGPADFLAKTTSVQFGMAAPAGESMPPLTSFAALAPATDPVIRDVYIKRLAEALEQQTIAAAIVEMERPQAESPLGSAGVSAAGSGTGAIGAGGDAFPGAEAAKTAELAEGTKLPLKDARLIRGDEFKKLVPRIVGR